MLCINLSKYWTTPALIYYRTGARHATCGIYLFYTIKTSSMRLSFNRSEVIVIWLIIQILTIFLCATVDFASSITARVIFARVPLTTLLADIDSFDNITCHSLQVAKSDKFLLHLFPDSWEHWRPGSRSWTRELENWKRGRSLGMRCYISRAFKIAQELANEDQVFAAWFLTKERCSLVDLLGKCCLNGLKKLKTANLNRTQPF